MAEEGDTWRTDCNPHKWVTKEKFLEFMAARNVSMTCERCATDNAWWIDTGAEGGYVPRIASMPTTAEGRAATGDTFQMPVVRAVCLNCGNIRLHALYALDLWRQNLGAAVRVPADDLQAKDQPPVEPK